MRNFVLQFLISSAVLWCFAGSCSAGRSETLTSIAAVHRMQRDAAVRRLPVEVEAVVTGTAMWPYGLTIQDRGEGIFVALAPGTVRRPAIGELVSVRGYGEEGQYAPIIAGGKIEAGRAGILPRPFAAQAEELATGKLDNLYVEVRGVVRAITSGPVGPQTGSYMVLDTQPGLVHIAIDSSIHLDVARFVDATIRAAGVVGIEYNNRRQALGARIFVGRLEDMTIVRPPSADPFSGPQTPAGDIFGWRVDRDWSHRIRVAGTLTLQRPGDFLVLQSGDQAIRVESPDAGRLPPGGHYEAAGFAAPTDFSPVLRDALIRRSGESERVNPLARKPSELINGNENWLLVTTEADLVEALPAGGGVAMSLINQGVRFLAEGQGSRMKELENLRPGSRLRLTGVCRVTTDALRNPRGFRLLLRSPEDIAVLTSGSWWNGTRVLWTAAIMGAAALLVALWALMLRDRVRVQTGWIAESLRREKEAARLYSARSNALELIGRNVPLQQVCEGLIETIKGECPGAAPAIAIRQSGGEHQKDTEQWIGPGAAAPEVSESSPVQVTSSSGALQAALYFRCPSHSPAPADLVQICRDCLSIAVEHHDLHQRLLQQSMSDPLTQLPNRRSLDSHLDRTLDKGRRCAILVLDMDGFKAINDTFGHEAGDIVLRELSRRFSTLMRPKDMIARVGGDEFVAVLEGVGSAREAREVAARLAAEASRPIEISGIEIHPSLSIGAAVYPLDGDSAQSLRNAADARMYKSKISRVADEAQPGRSDEAQPDRSDPVLR